MNGISYLAETSSASAFGVRFISISALTLTILGILYAIVSYIDTPRKLRPQEQEIDRDQK